MTGEFKTFRYKDFTFSARYWETSNAWGHECYLLRDGVGEVGKARYRYYNRTWECYTYQSVMFGAIEDYKKKELARYLNSRKIELELKGFKKDDDGEWREFDKPWPRGMKKAETEKFKESEAGKMAEELWKFVER